MTTRAALLAAGKAANLAPRKHGSVVACRFTLPHISLGAACPGAGTGRTSHTLLNVPLPCSRMYVHAAAAVHVHVHVKDACLPVPFLHCTESVCSAGWSTSRRRGCPCPSGR